MTHLQLNPTIPLDTPKGPADAHILIDYGPEHHVLYHVFVRATGEPWTFPSHLCKLEKNITGNVRVGEKRVPSLLPDLIEHLERYGARSQN